MDNLDFVLSAVNEKLHMQDSLLSIQREQIDKLKEKIRQYESAELEREKKEAM